MNRQHSSGQALLITLLVLAVALTAGLSLVARMTTDVSISKKEAQSSKAFEAAEAGIEEALRNIEVGTSVPSSLSLSPGGEPTNVSIDVTSLSGESAQQTISPGEVATFWLNSFSLDGEAFPSYEEGGVTETLSYDRNNVKFCWSGSDNIEAAVYYQESGYKTARYYLSGGGSCSAVENGQEATINLPAVTNTNNKFINIRFYGGANDTVTVAMEGVGADLPRQGTLITSTAATGDIDREIVVSHGWPVPPSFFDFAVFSGDNLSK